MQLRVATCVRLMMPTTFLSCLMPLTLIGGPFARATAKRTNIWPAHAVVTTQDHSAPGREREVGDRKEV
eukprot:6198440-Pleurochrysis_carterae.AAC.4